MVVMTDMPSQRQSEQRFRAAIDAVQGVLWTNTADGEMRGEQPGWAALTGQSIEEYQGFGWAKAVHPDDAQPSIDAWNLAVAQRRPFHFEHRVKCRDGQWRLFSVRAIPVLGPAGEILEWVGVHTDISERKAAEADRARLAAIVESAIVAIVSKTPDGRILTWNEAAARIFGYSATEVIGRPMALIIPPERLVEEQHILDSVRRGELVPAFETLRVTKDGRQIPVSMTVSPIRDASGAIVGASTIARDISERKRSEALLLAAQAERDTQKQLAEERARFAEHMVAIVSHDLRNPLAVVRLSAQRLATSDLSRTQQAVLKQLNDSNERAIRLIADLLDFSRGRLGTGLQIDAEPIELHTLVSDALKELTTAYPHRDIRHQRMGSGACNGNRDRLVQLVGNLVSNAVHYGAPDRPVRVVSMVGDSQFSISVHNEGKAIDAALLPTLFDPMTRGSSTDRSSGVGLGLFIVREIAQAHGGLVTVTSTQQDGTTFTATIPRQEIRNVASETPDLLDTASASRPYERTQHAESAAGHTTAKDQLPLRILCVEDDDYVRDAICAMLAADGREVVAVPSAEAALALIAENRFDLLITDLNLKGMSGADLARRWLQPDGSRWTVICSGFDVTPSLASLGLNVRSLRKPFHRQELDAVLREIQSSNRT